ncbi:MAG: hypothetical protein J0M19_04210 [Sphingomonadales bacterium]|nr:hypothetical protein [Sphingomonadales bacterium]
MVRKAFFYFEIALIAAVQVLSLLWATIGFWSANAQSVTPTNMDVVNAFMAELPPSDEMRRNASYTMETVHPFQASPATYRIYSHKNGKAKQALLQRAQSAFTEECNAKGGAIASRDSQDYALTIERLRPAAPDATILICIRPDRRPLGMLITLKRTVGRHGSRGDLSDAALDLVFGGGQPYYLIALQPPSAVYTQERLDREAANLAAAQQRQAAERERAEAQELAEVQNWRRTIKPGTETGCGPVLRVNGDLIEVVYYQTREPKWYRRSELWPSACR